MAEGQTQKKEPKWRYRLQLVSERHHRIVFTFSMPVWLTAIVAVLLALAIAFFALFIVTKTPLRQYLPGYLDVNKRAVVVESAMRIDSIAHASDLRDLYLNNLLEILSDSKAGVDKIERFDSAIVKFNDSILPASAKELEFREKYEKQERFGLNAISEDKLSASSFVNVVKGKVTLPEDDSEVDSFAGLRLSLDKEMPVLSPLESTLISVRYIIGSGYEVVLQCTNEYVIIISHLSSPFAEEGKSLKAGAVVGYAGKEKDADERWILVRIWHKGNPIDPLTVMDF